MFCLLALVIHGRASLSLAERGLTEIHKLVHGMVSTTKTLKTQTIGSKSIIKDT